MGRRAMQGSKGGYTALEEYMMMSSRSMDAVEQQSEQSGMVTLSGAIDRTEKGPGSSIHPHELQYDPLSPIPKSLSEDASNEGQLQHFKDTLGQFVSMKEMEALSWRYGLLKDQTTASMSSTAFKCTAATTSKTVSVHGTRPRDYLAEAESDLFGPGGILALSDESSAVTVQADHRRSKRQTSTFKSAPTPSTANITLIKGGGRWGEAMSFKEVGEQMRVSAE